MGIRPWAIVIGILQIWVHHNLVVFICMIVEYNVLSAMVLHSMLSFQYMGGARMGVRPWHIDLGVSLFICMIVEYNVLSAMVQELASWHAQFLIYGRGKNGHQTMGYI